MFRAKVNCCNPWLKPYVQIFSYSLFFEKIIKNNLTLNNIFLFKQSTNCRL